MKSKKIFLPVIILGAAIVVMSFYAVIGSRAYKPVITEKEFPFTVTYELDGKTETIESVMKAYYTGNGGYADTKTRQYKGEIAGLSNEAGGFYILKENEAGCVMLNTKLYPDYLMGDPEYDYFSDDCFEPQILYYDADGAEYTDAQTLAAHGIKLIAWEYPDPMENTLVFSHISYLSGAMVIPLALIALVALLAVIIFVKKEKEYIKKPLDSISLIFHFVIGFAAVPFLTIFGVLSDINGGSGQITQQMGYLAPAITILGLAASIGLRRKGFSKSGFIVQFTGPVVFALIVVAELAGMVF